MEGQERRKLQLIKSSEIVTNNCTRSIYFSKILCSFPLCKFPYKNMHNEYFFNSTDISFSQQRIMEWVSSVHNNIKDI